MDASGSDSRSRMVVRSWPGSLLPATPANRFLAVATIQTAVVATLAAVASDVSLFSSSLQGISSSYPAPAASGPAPLATTRVLDPLVYVLVGLYLGAPVAVGAYRLVRSDRHWLGPVVETSVALFALPWLAYVLLVATSQYRPGLVEAAAVLVVGPALVVLAHRVATGHETEAVASRPPATAFFNVAVTVAVVFGAVVGSGVLAGTLDAHVEDSVLYVTLDYEYTSTSDGRGLLTVTNDGGPAFDAARVTVEGMGFADVPGADQTEPGPWAGATTDVADGGRVVGAGDSVVVGVASDCAVRVEYSNYTVGDTYRCPDADDPTDGSVDRPTAGGNR